jgi:hypothetical protein
LNVELEELSRACMLVLYDARSKTRRYVGRAYIDRVALVRCLVEIFRRVKMKQTLRFMLRGGLTLIL